MIDAYPLTWPGGWKRTPPERRPRANFKRYGNRLSIADGVARVFRELRQMGCRDGDIIVSTNVLTNSLGLPRSDQRMPDDPGVAVYWETSRDKARKVMAVDRYDLVADNLAAVAATLEAMRAIERHGGAQILERVFTGFTALPAPGQTTARGWRDVLGFQPAERLSLSFVENRYKTLRSRYHTDRPDGDAHKFHEVQTAWEQAKQELVE